jgi:hypothetical protein
MAEVGQGDLTPGWRGQGWPAPPGGLGPLLLLPLSPSGYFRLLVIYEGVLASASTGSALSLDSGIFTIGFELVVKPSTRHTSFE